MLVAAKAQPAARPLVLPLVTRPSSTALLPQTAKAVALAAQASAARIQAFEAAISADAWDVAAWDGRLREAVHEGKPGPVFERAVKQFPCSARIWTAYAEWSESQEGEDAALSVYERCLQQVPSLDLWSSYLTFCKRNLPVEEVIRAYQRAVDLLGTDWRAGLLWAEYLALLKRCYNAHQRKENPDAEVSGKLLAEDPNPIEAARRALKPGLQRRKPDQPSKPVEVPEEEFLKAGEVLNVDVQLLRSAFQRAAGSAHSVLDKLWIGYEQFEKSLGNPQMAQRLLREHMPRYIRGKASFKELQNLCSGIDHFAVALPLRAKNTAQQTRILEKWRGVLQYERTNPLRLAKHEVQPRVTLCYQQAALSCAFHAEIWHDFVTWLDICEQKQQATACLQRAVQRFLPQDLVLRLLLAHRHELAEVPPSNASLDLADAEYAQLLEDMPKPCPLALINNLAFVRRQRSADEFRDAFIAAESSPHCTPDVYTFAALTEYRVFGSTEAAARVFRLGLERYGDREPSLLAAYVNFLTEGNDLQGARAELSRSVLDRLQVGVREHLANRVDPSVRDSLSFFWQKWTRLERYFGDASAMQRAYSFRDEEYQNLQRDQEVEDDALQETPVVLGLSASIAEVEESFRFQHLVPKTSRIGHIPAMPSLPEVVPKPAATAIGTAAAAKAAEHLGKIQGSAPRMVSPPSAATQPGSSTSGSASDTATQAAQQLGQAQQAEPQAQSQARPQAPKQPETPTQAAQPEPFSALSTTPVDQALLDAAEENRRLATPAPAANMSVHIARPDVSKMLAFRPALDVIGRKRMAESVEKMRPDELAALPTMIPKCLQDLLAVLPGRPLKGAKPDIDYLLTVLQTNTIPPIPVSELDRICHGGFRSAQEEHVPMQLSFTKDDVDISANDSFFSSRPTLVRDRLQAKRQKVFDEQQVQA